MKLVIEEKDVKEAIVHWARSKGYKIAAEDLKPLWDKKVAGDGYELTEITNTQTGFSWEIQE